TVRLSSAGALSQATPGVITATNLGVQAVGNITLPLANQVNGIFAAQTTGAGSSIVFASTSVFTEGTISASGCCPAINQVTTNGGSITLTNPAGTLTLTNTGQLIINGDRNGLPTDDTFRLLRDAANPAQVDIFINGAELPPFTLSQIQEIDVNGLAGND